MTRKRRVLIVGATGTQGGAVADRLLSQEQYEVSALTRSPSSVAARALHDQGATVVTGDLDDRASLRQALEDVDCVFAVTDYFATNDPAAERRQGVNIAEVAAETGVEQYVYSSALGAESGTDVPHFRSKFEIEQRIDAVGLPFTVVRLAPYLQNLEAQRAAILAGLFGLPLDRNIPVPLVNVADLGFVVDEIFTEPAAYASSTVELVGDVHSTNSAARIISAVTGVPMTTFSVPSSVTRWTLGREIESMYDWFETEPCEWERIESPFDEQLTTLQQYLREQGWDDSSWCTTLGRTTGPIRPTV